MDLLRRTSFLLGLTAVLAATAPSLAAAQPSAFQSEQQMSYRQLMQRWNPLIAEASQRFDIPEIWICSVMQVESGGRTMSGENQPITSSAGAMGLMQIMPSTYRDMQADHGLGPNPYSPRDNILAGAAYLHWLDGKYGYPALFAAYNDGPGNLAARLLDAGLLPAETRSYLARVTAAVAGREFLTGHGKPVRFTRPNGLPVLIDPGAVLSIRAVLPGEYASGVNTVITYDRIHQAVCETLSQVQTKLHFRGTTA
ncbi:MAG TPA: lytic transglycosylase domain-containing protein [Rhizomicrobium sp.]|nr:lytic transglycosylase domain-containing protein [Rhizomicrobium sp.]